MVGVNRGHPIYIKTSLYVNIPFYMVDKNISSESRVVYERVDGGLIIKVGDVK